MSISSWGTDLIGLELDGRYQVVRKLGEGGMGAVYLARQLVAERDVALKVIRESQMSDSRAVNRFMHEARSCCSLHHPNIVTVHDFGRTKDGTLYIVMELLDGTPLVKVVERGCVELERVLNIGAQICAGLQEAHRNGIVHRDLKPDNIMLCPVEGIDDFVKILDFGIAKSLDRDVSSHSTVGAVVGTPAYMSPEHASGDPVDARSDIYSFGVLLYEMLTGRPPFVDESNVSLLVKHMREPVPPLSQFRAARIPPDLEDLVMRCLEKKPADRPQTASEVRLALTGGGVERDVPEVVLDIDDEGPRTRSSQPWSPNRCPGTGTWPSPRESGPLISRSLGPPSTGSTSRCWRSATA